MLKIWYKGGVDFVINAQTYFQNVYEDEWITDPLVKEIIRDVDKSEVIDGQLINSSKLGLIPPERLSGGVQVLILLLKDNSRTYNISNCGDNCAKWILDIASKKDVEVYLEHIMRFEGDFTVKIMNTDKIVHGFGEYVSELLKAERLQDEREENN